MGYKGMRRGPHTIDHHKVYDPETNKYTSMPSGTLTRIPDAVVEKLFGEYFVLYSRSYKDFLLMCKDIEGQYEIVTNGNIVLNHKNYAILKEKVSETCIQ